MLNLDLNQPRLKILLIILAVILVVVLGFTCYSINKKMKLESQKNASIPEAQEKNKPLTSEEIQEALNKKAEVPEGETSALTPKEIQDTLNKKAPAATDVKPLTSEEIQSALNAKAN